MDYTLHGGGVSKSQTRLSNFHLSALNLTLLGGWGLCRRGRLLGPGHVKGFSFGPGYCDIFQVDGSCSLFQESPSGC